LGDGTIQTAQSVAAGSYTPPGQTKTKTGLPAFCRVTAAMHPTADSNINVEVWMPQTNWNGRFLGTGNGGGAGSISYDSGIVEGLKRGFATANNDLGTSPAINTTVGHPERWADFGYRANHEMTVAGKALVNAYYKSSPKTSYFQGCSTGGQQALSIAQRYPNDYNGILAGAPANNRTHLHSMFVWTYTALNKPGAKLTQGKVDMITSHVVASCAGKDGGATGDHFLTDPRQCHFDPDTLPKCTNGDSDSCLTDAQITGLKAVYAGPVNPRTGERIHAGEPFGTENGPLGFVLQSDTTFMPANQFYPFYWTFGTNWNYTTYDFDHDMDTVDQTIAPLVNANDANLKQFKANGGKLIMWTGTADPAVPMPGAIDYYERVVQQQGGDLAATQDFFRYFLVPGMGHCAASGPGLTDFGQAYSPVVPPDDAHDILLKMVDWVEKQNAPSQVIASKYTTDTPPKVSMERPLCVYPDLPSYQGGDATKSASFVCKPATRGGVDTPALRYLN
jgi:feruloyl esterase